MAEPNLLQHTLDSHDTPHMLDVHAESPCNDHDASLTAPSQEHGPFGVSYLQPRRDVDVNGNWVDVNGNRKVPGSWAQLERQGYPLHGSMPEQDRLQWRQEINELKAVDDAVDEYRRLWLPQAAEGEEEACTPTPAELIGRLKVQRQMARYEWFSKLRETLLQDMRAAVGIHGKVVGVIDGTDGPMVQLESGTAGGSGTSAAGIHGDQPAEAAQQTNRAKLAELRLQGVTKPTLLAIVEPSMREMALRAVRVRFAHLFKKQEADSEQGWEIAQLTQTLDELKGLPENATKAEVDGVISRGSVKNAERRALLENFNKLVDTRLRHISDRLATLTIHEVASSTLLAQNFRRPVAELSLRLGGLVQVQYGRDAIVFSSQQSSQVWKLHELFEPEEKDECAGVAAAMAHTADEGDDNPNRTLMRKPAEQRLATMTQRQGVQLEEQWPVLNRQRLRIKDLQQRANGHFDPEEIRQRKSDREDKLMHIMDTRRSRHLRSELSQEEEERLSEAEKRLKQAIKRARMDLASADMRFPESTIPQSCLFTPWVPPLTARVGTYLVWRLVGCATFGERLTNTLNMQPTPALASGESKAFEIKTVRQARTGKFSEVCYVQAADSLHEQLVTGDLTQLRLAIHPEEMPMLVPPLSWTNVPLGEEPDATPCDSLPRGGFFHCDSDFVRTHCRGHLRELRSTPAAQMASVFESLDALAATGWRINRPMLDLVERMWDGSSCPEHLKTGVAFLPDREDKIEPAYDPREFPSESDWYIAQREHERACRLVRKHNAELHSMRCTTKLKLDVAAKLKEDVFYYPYNLDFRGRVYPVSPHLTHLGDDLCRGLLVFAEKRPLGSGGLRWLKIHLANLYGMDKLPLDAREKWADGAIASGILRQVHEDAMSPTAQDWWQKADNALQTIAVARELHLASTAPDPAAYLSDIPVHQDGSCNGLQHYAAMLRDPLGAKQVNLTPSAEPQDVYAGVRALVAQKVQDDADAGDPMAVQLAGLVSRKVVKQTVMTSVYGVTFTGARQQIQNRLEEVKELEGATEEELFAMAKYLAILTLQSLGTVFSGATDAMGWMSKAASHVAKVSRAPVQWTTPLGLPVVQPYMKPKTQRVKTVLAQLSLTREMDPFDESARVNTSKQKSAFSPNYVHSIDSTHLMLTAVECRRRGLVFTAVHDSYWTHACDVDEMNEVLRAKFVDLYSQPLLEQLLSSFKQQYPEVEWDDTPELQLPKQGELDIDLVKKSVYFFA